MNVQNILYQIPTIYYCIILALIVEIDAKTVPVEKLSLGDIVNINNLNQFSIKVLGDVFSGHEDAKFSHELNENANNNTIFFKKICLDSNSAASHFFPGIFVNQKRFLNAKNLFKADYLKTKLFPTNSKYVNDETFIYGTIKVCGNIRVQNMKIKMIEKNNASKFDSSKFYVAHLINGRCLFQVSFFKILKNHSKSNFNFFSISKTGFCKPQKFLLL